MDPLGLQEAIEKALRDAGVLALVTGFFLNDADENSRIPYIILTLPAELLHTRTNTNKIHKSQFRIDCAAISFPKARKLANEVVAALTETDYDTQDGQVLTLHEDGRSYMEEVGFYRAIQNMTALVDKERVR